MYSPLLFITPASQDYFVTVVLVRPRYNGYVFEHLKGAWDA
jgi:hypothetical protein